jgi:membrane protein YdbS with pleckstrin-like domain
MDLLAERRISDKAFVGHYLAAGLIGLILAVVLFFIPGMGLFAPVGLLLPLAGVFVYSRLMRMSSCYRLFPDRLEIDSGILSRKIENVELFRVRDVGLRQGFIGRMADFGDIYLHSTDSSTPDLHVRAVDAPKELYQQLRELVSESRAKSRTLIMEESHSLPEP